MIFHYQAIQVTCGNWLNLIFCSLNSSFTGHDRFIKTFFWRPINQPQVEWTYKFISIWKIVRFQRNMPWDILLSIEIVTENLNKKNSSQLKLICTHLRLMTKKKSIVKKHESCDVCHAHLDITIIIRLRYSLSMK